MLPNNDRQRQLVTRKRAPPAPVPTSQITPALIPPFDGIDEGLGMAEEFELVEVARFGA